MSQEQQRFIIVYEEKDQDFVEQKVAPLFDDCLDKVQFLDEFLANLDSQTHAVLYLDGRRIKDNMLLFHQKNISFSVLPHPLAVNVYSSLGVSPNLQKAVDFLLKQKSPIKLDVLFSNDRPIFNHIVVGDTFQLVTKKVNYPISLFRRIRGGIYRFFTLKPFPLELHFKNKNSVKTVAAGAIVIQHRNSSLLARIIPGESFIREGMFHVFILSPRSIFELIKYGVNSFFKKNYFPTFGAHVKTNKMTFECPQGRLLTFTEDGNSYKESILELEIKEDFISIYPGEFLSLDADSGTPSEIYKVSSLPTPEAAKELSLKSLPLITSATTEDFKELFQVLRDNAQLKSSYLVLMVLATTLATFGLFADSTPVVIGAMILAPLMAPIITLSMATLRQDKKLILQSSATILVGMGVAFLFAVFITWITPIATANHEILARVRPTLLDLGVAVVSGVAGAYAHAREEVAKTLAGVAISVALVPPLAVSAIGFGWGDLAIFWGASLLLFTNLAGMVLAGALTFLLLGYSPFRLAQKGVVISFVTVMFLSIPLAIGFNRMVFEHNVVQALSELQVEESVLSDIKVQRISPLRIALKVVAQDPVSSDQLDQIKETIESKLSREVELEFSTAIIR